MKKALSILICLIICISSALTAYAGNYTITSIDKSSYLSSNLIYNGNFDDTNDESFWKFKNVNHQADNSERVYEYAFNYETITVQEKGALSALGYSENAEKAKPSIAFEAGEKYDFSCYIKNISFDGKIYVYLNTKSNKNFITELDISNSTHDWKKISCELESLASETGALTIELNGAGTICIDEVKLIPHSAHGYGDDRYKSETIRAELYNAIADLKPTRIAFRLDDYERGTSNWSATIGSPEDREFSGVGITEYFNLCEDIGAELVPTFNIINVSEDSENYGEYTQNILNLIEYANGDSFKTYWGALRAANGHPEPYNLKYIAFEPGANTDAIAKEINKKHADIIVITEADSVTEEYISVPPAASQTNNDFIKTALFIAAPCAAVIAVAVIIIVLKKRKV